MPAEALHPTRRPLAELAGVYFAMQGFIWEPWFLFHWPAAVSVTARIALAAILAVSLVASYLRVRDDRRRLGLAPDSLTAGFAPLLGFTVLGVVALGLASWSLGTVQLDSDRVVWAGRYIVGLIGQQVLLQCFVNNRLHDVGERLWPHGPVAFTVVVAALMFSTLHLPNPYLAGLTLIAGGFWVWHFRRHANLPLLCASHLILGAAAMLLLGKGPLLSLRVGYGAWKKMFDG